jgi:hypothetical protein
MTYNFDPDRWYDNQKLRLDARRAAGELDEAAYEAALEALDARYDAMCQRLDGTYELAPAKDTAR